jgi:predicted nuclease of predicted toxin-antitoxin system
MKFLIDECLHESLVGVAHGAGFEATHVNHPSIGDRAFLRLTRSLDSAYGA